MKQYAKMLLFLLVMVVAIPIIRLFDRVLEDSQTGGNES